MEHPEKSSSESQPQSRLPLIALILSLSSILFGGVSFASFYVSIQFFNLQYFNFGPVGYLAVCLSFVGILAPFVGIIAGGVSLARGYPQKVMSIIAILVGILAMIVMAFVALIVSYFTFGQA